VPLTTTHFSLLCLLSVQPYSAYEMVKQMGRSVGLLWPRAKSNLYADLKRLATEGLAEAERTSVGRRGRTVYRITDAGRIELSTWLAEAGAPPSFECEALVKLGFAPHTTKTSALGQVAVLAEQADQRLRLGRALAEEHIAADGPLPQRLHVNAVMWRFLWEYHQAIARWAAWAQQEISDWPDTADSPANRERGRAALRAGLLAGDRTFG
jgi:DNA-binding PadR family transcriptional regulator